MPKPTFLNLPADKRDGIVRIAVDEFAATDYDAVSISKIVADAGIAKGSFYQYFEDKFDLYRYLLDEGVRMKADFLAQHPATGDTASPFVYLRWLLKTGLHFDFAHRKMAKIAQRALNGETPFPVEWRQNIMTQSIAFYSNLVKQGITGGYLRADLDAELAGYTLYSVMRDMNPYILQRLQAAPDTDDYAAVYAQHEAEVERIFDMLFTTLERGMGH